MSKRVKHVKKVIRQGVLDVAYLDAENVVKYASVQIDAYTKNRKELVKMAQEKLGREGIKLLSLTEVLITYEMPINQFLANAIVKDGVEGETIRLDEE